MKTNASLALPSAFLSLGTAVLIDSHARQAIATDGEAIVLHPLPPEFKATRLVHVTPEMPPITPDSGDATSDTYDLTALEHPPVYRIAVTARKLAHLAEAMQNEIVILELPADPAGKPIKVLPWSGAKTGYLMPAGTPPGVVDGLLVETGTGKTRKVSEPKPEVQLPPPVVTTHADRGTVEVFFGGRPPKEITTAIGRQGIGFSYSGERGTKKGVPPKTWYAPNNEFFRGEVSKLLNVQIQSAA